MILVPRKCGFYSVIDHVNDSLFKQMKANGYYTVVLTPLISQLITPATPIP